MASIDDPLLKELLAALKEDSRRMAEDLLSVITTQALIAAFALFLAISSLVRLVLFEYIITSGGFVFRRGLEVPDLIDTSLTLVLFVLSLVSIYNVITLRSRYSRLLALAEKLGR